MDRRQPLFSSQNAAPSDLDLVKTRVNFLHHPDDARRRRGELRSLTPDEKMLCALRKVLSKMSSDSGGHERYFVVSPHCRVLARQGDAGTYRTKGRCQIGIAHGSGEAAFKMIEFDVSFRDTEDAMGLPDVDYFDPTHIDEIDPRTPV